MLRNRLKSFRWIMIGSLLLALVCGGCTQSNPKETREERKEELAMQETTEQEASEQEASEQEASEQEVTNQEEIEQELIEQDSPSIPKYEVELFDIPSNQGTDLVKALKIGWNLGNTFDAFTDGVSLSNELDTETAWVGRKTTKENIQAIKAAGFETLRIPITWHNHIDEEFTITTAWLDRVEEVVNYGIDEGLYVIINIHHDIDQKYYYPSPEYLESSKKYVQRIWEQLSLRFAQYDDQLIFEAVNEPRMVGTENEWWLDLNKKECVDSIEVINELNQLFVDTVRSSGGMNELRFLLVPGYSASPEGVLNEYFQVPKDVEGLDDHILLSVHAYRPYSFALQGPSESGSTQDFSVDSTQQVNEILSFMDDLYEKYISQGIPVLLGEFGARNKNNNLEDRVSFASFYIKSALERGMSACWWDNHAFIGNGENFGLLDRRLNIWVDQEIIDAMMQYFY